MVSPFPLFSHLSQLSQSCTINHSRKCITGITLSTLSLRAIEE